MPVLEKIESAIRDLKAKTDEVEEQRRQDTESRDLKAQVQMARWALWMFIATAVTVILTAIALWAIIRTLHHTKRAADYTGHMLNEAKATTLAAKDSVADTRRIGEAQVEQAKTAAIEAKSIGDAQVAESKAAVEAARSANAIMAKQFQMSLKPQLKFHLDGPYIDEAIFPLKIFDDGELPRLIRIEVYVAVENISKNVATITKFFIDITGHKIEIMSAIMPIDIHIIVAPNEKIILNKNIDVTGGKSFVSDIPRDHPNYNTASRCDLAQVACFHLTPENRDDFMRSRPKI